MVITTAPSIPAESVRRIPHYLVTRFCYFNYPLSFTFFPYISLLLICLAFQRDFCYREKVKEQANPMTIAAHRVTRSKDSNLFKDRRGQGQGRVGKARQGRGKCYVSKTCGRKSKISKLCYPFLYGNINSVLYPCPALVSPVCLTLLLLHQS